MRCQSVPTEDRLSWKIEYESILLLYIKSLKFNHWFRPKLNYRNDFPTLFLTSREETFHETFSSLSRRKWDRRVSSYFSLAIFRLYSITQRLYEEATLPVLNQPTISWQRAIVSRHNRASSLWKPMRILHVSCHASLSPIMSPREEGGGAGTLLRSLSRCVWHLTRRLPSVVTDFSLTFLLFVSTLPDSRRNVFRYIRWKDALARSYFGSYLSFKRYNGIIRVDWIGKYLFVISLKIWLDIYKKYINICDSKP